MFGIIRPCRHRLSERLHASWLAHLCGLCLALRDDHGQLARTATNYDGLVISVLVEAQSPRAADRRTAGPCPLRGMRTAPVARGEGARLAAAVSLALASVKVRDHVLDGDGVFARRSVAAGARRITRRWERQSTGSAAAVGFDTGVLLAAAGRQEEAERLVTAGGPLLLATAPTEEATAAAFAHTAVLAGRPGNATALAEAGRLFGRLAHLLDAAEDRQQDEAQGLWNPLTVSNTSQQEAQRLCRDAVHGIRLALAEVEFTDRVLVHRLLAHETGAAVDRVFGRPGHACASTAPPGTDPDAPADPHLPPPGPQKPRRDGVVGCAVWLTMACTCQLLCCEHDDPFSRDRRNGFCQRNCDSCCDCCDCCNGCDPDCCNCCGSCDDGCCSSCDCGCDCS
ncbi:DUF5685 family protein [Kitasatospora sp. CB01950]|uniref:DUF5685 family protein n=1 Tax=Kitasatospora sp. CB01950 TaxID=1703930 RepID=UPI00093FCE19|nr:DUF5685 family protein [Kitasatospora sp. CB01950]OKJ13634.1 hypothetical protein AMK19_09290 [Kitasatospora sp. CB01950]